MNRANNDPHEGELAEGQATSALEVVPKGEGRLGEWNNRRKLISGLKSLSHHDVDEIKVDSAAWSHPDVERVVLDLLPKLIKEGSSGRAATYVANVGLDWTEVRTRPEIQEEGVRFIVQKLESAQKDMDKASSCVSYVKACLKDLDLGETFQRPELRSVARVTVMSLLNPLKFGSLASAKELVEAFAMDPVEFSSPDDQLRAGKYISYMLEQGSQHKEANAVFVMVGFDEEKRRDPGVAAAAMTGLKARLKQEWDCEELKLVSAGGFLPEQAFSDPEVISIVQAKLVDHLKKADTFYFAQAKKTGKVYNVPLEGVVDAPFQERLRSAIYSLLRTGRLALLEDVNASLQIPPAYYQDPSTRQIVHEAIRTSWKEGREVSPQVLADSFGYPIETLRNPDDQKVLSKTLSKRLGAEEYRSGIETVVNDLAAPYATTETLTALRPILVKAVKEYLGAKKIDGTSYAGESVIAPKDVLNLVDKMQLKDIETDGALRQAAFKALGRCLRGEGRFEKKEGSSEGVPAYASRFNLEESMKGQEGKELSRLGLIASFERGDFDEAKELFYLGQLGGDVFQDSAVKGSIEKGWASLIEAIPAGSGIYDSGKKDAVARIRAIRERYPQFVPTADHPVLAKLVWRKVGGLFLKQKGDSPALKDITNVLEGFGWDSSAMHGADAQSMFKEVLIRLFNDYPGSVSKKLPDTIRALQISDATLQDSDVQTAYHACRNKLVQNQFVKGCVPELDHLFGRRGGGGAYRT